MLYEQNSQVIQVDMSRSYCYRKVVAIRRFPYGKMLHKGSGMTHQKMTQSMYVTS